MKENYQKRKQILKRSIMRHIYYAYAISLFFKPAFTQGAALSVASLLLWQTVSLPDILKNFAATPVGQAPQFVWRAFTGTETVVLFLIGVIVLTLLSFGFSRRSTKPVESGVKLA